MFGYMKVAMSNPIENKIPKSVVMKCFFRPRGELNAKEVPLSQKNTGMVYNRFKHVILRMYRHHPPRQCFSTYRL